MEDKVRQIIKKDTLCNNNVQVKYYLNSIKKRLKQLGISDVELSELLNDSLEVLRVMKKMGQKLEDRCRTYRVNIEKCGFKRVKGRSK